MKNSDQNLVPSFNFITQNMLNNSAWMLSGRKTLVGSIGIGVGLCLCIVAKRNYIENQKNINTSNLVTKWQPSKNPESPSVLPNSKTPMLSALVSHSLTNAFIEAKKSDSAIKVSADKNRENLKSEIERYSYLSYY